MVFLSKVEHAFTIPGRGCVIVPVALTDTTVHNGDALQLRSPSGTIREARILGIELIKQRSGPCRLGFLLSSDIVKEDAPPETEIWLSESKYPTTSNSDHKIVLVQ